MDDKEKRYCQGEECENGGALCCADCPDRCSCPEVCDGPDGKGIYGPCEYRV